MGSLQYRFQESVSSRARAHNKDAPAHATEGRQVSERPRDHSRNARHGLEEDHAVQICAALWRVMVKLSVMGTLLLVMKTRRRINDNECV